MNQNVIKIKVAQKILNHEIGLRNFSNIFRKMSWRKTIKHYNDVFILCSFKLRQKIIIHVLTTKFNVFTIVSTIFTCPFIETLSNNYFDFKCP